MTTNHHHDEEYEAVCECDGGKVDKIIIPIRLVGGVDPAAVTVDCPQCGQPLEVTPTNA